MKKNKTKLSISLSVLFIGFLICSSSLNTLCTNALVEEKNSQYEIDSFDRFIWKWTTTEVVSSDNTDFSYFPSLATDSAGNVHVAWESVEVGGTLSDHKISYKRWDTYSDSWTTTEIISTESTSGSFNPSIAVDSANNLHVVWNDQTNYAGCGIDDDIFYKRWDDSSSTWSTTEVVSTESTDYSFLPSLAVDSAGNVHVAWEDWTDYAGCGIDEDIFYKRWNSSTSLWTTTEVVSTESTADSYWSSLAVDSSGSVHVAWVDQTDYAESGTDEDIFYKRWDSATYSWATFFWNWTNTEVISTESTEHSEYPSLAIDSEGTVHVAWFDITDYAGAGTDEDIFYKVLTGLPKAPELAFIVPNPTDVDNVYLDWNNVFSAITYHIYRSSSYIWSVKGLVPIASVSSSEYIDTLPSEGFYYYVVITENYVGNGSRSNCQYVEVKFPDLKAPELALILPNPTDLTSISLVWDSVEGATEYYVYRSASYIWHVEALTPIDTVVSNTYLDTLPSEGLYFYVIVASDGLRNSTHSNCEYVDYKLPTLHEFVIFSSLILGTFVFLFVIMRTRKKNSKPN